MCFFILWLSFTANVEENAWEFGVLRAIGLNVSRPHQHHQASLRAGRSCSLARLVRPPDCAPCSCWCAGVRSFVPPSAGRSPQSVEVVLLYVYESLSLVLASVVLGTGIGLAIAATLTLQFNLFTELPFHMEFPTGLFLTMLAMAIAVATIGSGLPAYRFLNKTISSVLRRQ